MIRVIKYNLIIEKKKYILEKKDELVEIKNKLENDIKEIINYYKGEDSYLLTSSYLKKIEEIDNYLNSVTKYLDYLEWISNRYSECYNKNFKKLQMIGESSNE